MQNSATAVAFKEWSVVCQVIAERRQSVLIRKGGIHEGFRVEHQEFWLFPTRFHQGAEAIRPQFRDVWERVNQQPVDPAAIAVQHHITVLNVTHVTDAQQLEEIEGRQCLSRNTLEQRFRYRAPGLFVLDIEVDSLPDPVMIPDEPSFGGCQSWVPLPLPPSGSNQPM